MPYLKLPDFAPSKSIFSVLVEDHPSIVGRHNIIFGSVFLQELGFKFDYSGSIITRDDVSTSMKPISSHEINSK